MKQPRTALLTGVGGFIAKRFAPDLLSAGWAVRGSLGSPGRSDEVRAAIRPQLADPSALDRPAYMELDLTRDAAASGVDALVHTASPFPMAQPDDDDARIRPAVDGTLRALGAARWAGVARVVLTSPLGAVMNADGVPGRAATEEAWTDPAHPTTTAYDKSTTLAERAAWSFAAEHSEVQLSTIAPGLVTGRPLDAHSGTSLGLVERVFRDKDQLVPDFGLPVADVADMSRMHVAALERPETSGKGYIASDAWTNLPEIARWLTAAHPGRKTPTRVAPKWLLHLLSRADPSVRSILPTLGRRLTVRNRRARDELGITFVPARDSVLATAAFLSEHGR